MEQLDKHTKGLFIEILKQWVLQYEAELFVSECDVRKHTCKYFISKYNSEIKALTI